jgi:very-short-patch-repair endonuclease
MKHNIIPYNPTLKDIARTLRNNSTLGEVMLWKQLRNKQMLGYDFHRQRPIDQFIVDFYSPKLKLAIEIDGGSHETEDAFEKDKARQARLESLGIKLLRFKESEVRKNMRGVLDVIEHWIKTDSTHPHPLSPSHKNSNAAEGS